MARAAKPDGLGEVAGREGAVSVVVPADRPHAVVALNDKGRNTP